MLYAKDFMTPIDEIVTVYMNETLEEVGNKLLSKGIGSVAVKNQNEDVIGIITKTDLLHGLILKLKTTADKIMSTKILKVDQNEHRTVRSFLFLF
jgi:predicted transcriptional regulator